MWLSGRQKRPADRGEGQTGTVTVGGGDAAVMLDSERRGLEVYAPAGYRWTPEVNQRVLVIQGQGELPCIVGVRQDGVQPQSVGISANTVDISANTASISGRDVSVQAGGSAVIAGQSVDLQGQVLINGTPLETLIVQIAAAMLEGGAGT